MRQSASGELRQGAGLNRWTVRRAARRIGAPICSGSADPVAYPQ